MPSYSYRGRSAGGQLVEGMLDAATESAVADHLAGQRITPLEIEPAQGRTDGGTSGGTSGGMSGGMSAPAAVFGDKVRHIDVLLFSRQMYTLLKAGVPIMRALAGLQESTGNPAMKRLLQQVRANLDAGRELAMCLAMHPAVFTTFYVSMVRVAELTGRLQEVFLSLFHHLEFEKSMRDQVKSALRYPSFVVAAMAIAIVIVNIWVIPTFARVFKGFNTELPLMTRVLIGFSDFMIAYGWLLFLATVGAYLAFRAWIGTTRGRFLWDRFKLRIPVAGKIVRKATLARFARSLSLATKSGVPVVQAITVVAQTVDNAYLASRIERMRDGVERGESILKTAIAADVFTPVVLQMVAVGEESGALDDMMEEIADMYQREVEYELRTLGQQIEPILIVFLGVLVLILALGIFLPIWDLGKAAIRR
jgi:MSHA biogenesis protein MshG